MRDKNLIDGIKRKDRADLPYILSIREEVTPCLHTGDFYNMSDE